jgi:hypothetical protein
LWDLLKQICRRRTITPTPSAKQNLLFSSLLNSSTTSASSMLWFRRSKVRSQRPAIIAGEAKKTTDSEFLKDENQQTDIANQTPNLDVSNKSIPLFLFSFWVYLIQENSRAFLLRNTDLSLSCNCYFSLLFVSVGCWSVCSFVYIYIFWILVWACTLKKNKKKNKNSSVRKCRIERVLVF